MLGKGFILRLAIILAALVVAALLSACGGGKEVFSIPPTVLSSPTGEVMVLQEGSTEWTEASAGMDIGMGDCVKTGPDGNALLMFFEGSVMEIEEDTEVCIEELSIAEDTGSTFIKVWQQVGRTINRVEQLADPASGYEVETPAGASVTRGTRFEVLVGWDGITTLKTFSGEAWFCVEVEEEEEEERECILVPLGMQCTTEPGGPLGEVTPSDSDSPAPPEEPAPPSEPEDDGGWGGGGGGGGGWVPPPQVPELTLTKSADVATANVGETITYSFSVENTGDTTISGITLSDPLLGGTITLDVSTLAPDETASSIDGPYTYTVVEDDLPGPLENTATVSGTDSQGGPVSDKDTESVMLTYTSELTLSKSADVATANVGETITYSFSVENTGDTTISGITLNDPLLETITLDLTTLAPDETASSIDGPYTYTVVEDDLPGPLENTATVSGADSQGNQVSDDDTESVELTYTSELTLSKEADVGSANVGDTITYDFVVENTGDTTISNITLSDPLLETITLDLTTLAPGETANSTGGPYTYTVVEDDLPSPLDNEATVSGTDSQGDPVSDKDTESVVLTYTSELTLTKSADKDSAHVGETITYSFSVENTGDTTISGITLSDPMLGTITLDPTTLAPGGMASSIDGPYTYTVVEGDLPGPLENTATVSGTDSQGEPASDTATWRVDIYRLGISVAKSADKATANVGDVIIYSFTVENTGDVDLEFTAYDSLLNVSWSGFITQGSSATLSHPYTVPQGADDPLVNEVTATGTDDLGKTVTATATCSVDILHPEISVTKEGPTFAYEGDVITYTITNVPTYGGPRALYVISP